MGETDVRKVVLRGDFVELNKLLKFENLVMSGGEAKTVITSELVEVNDAVETRIRRKLVAGDRVSFAGNRFEIVASE